MVRERDYAIEASRRVDRAIQALVPTMSTGRLPTDPKHLETMFMFCTKNWRTYPGEKPQGEKLARINALYKQATLGDCKDKKGETPSEKALVKIWRRYKGTPSLMAKRRFLALLQDVDPRLLQIKAYKFVPLGFPTSAKGGRICPYSNTKRGCPRPLMDKYGRHLEDELSKNERLSDFVTLRNWLDEMGSQQRCSLGLHVPISKNTGARFATFFARPECEGFHPYASEGLHEMVKEVLKKQVLDLAEMQNNPWTFSHTAHALQRDRFLGLQARRECERLGVTPVTGPMQSIDHRYRALQQKIVDVHRNKMLLYESHRRQRWRSNVALFNNDMVKKRSLQNLSECLQDALTTKDLDRVCRLVESGVHPSTEIHGGLFPLMAATLKRSTSHIQRLLAAGADIDTVNSRGMTALMWAVKCNDYAMVDALLEHGAEVGIEGCTGWTAMGVAARHGRFEIAKLMVENLRREKLTGESKADRVLNHRSTINGGLTPVAIAAIHRNEIMVRCLMRLGAKPEVECHKGYGAGYCAIKAGWTDLGRWLQKTRAYGSKGVYTFTDISAESTLRVASIRMLKAIVTGASEGDFGVARKKTASDKPAHTISPSESMRSSETPRTSSDDYRLGISKISPQVLVRPSTLLTVKVLREGHAAPDTETDGGHTALISAAYRGLETCVQELIQEGADPNYSNRSDRTALMAAATAGHQNTVLVLLKHGADAARVDIDGKVAGRYAFERGFCELAEMLAVAASQGNDLALDWEVKRRTRTEEAEKRKLIQRGKHQADWIIHAMNATEAASSAEMKQPPPQRLASRQPGMCAGPDGDGTIAQPSQVQQSRRRGRCPKCTLLVPCCHYASFETFMAQFPDGVPEWEWNKRGVAGKFKLGGRKRLIAQCGSKDRMFMGGEDVAWWRALHRAHRDRELALRLSSGARNAIDGTTITTNT